MLLATVAILVFLFVFGPRLITAVRATAVSIGSGEFNGKTTVTGDLSVSAIPTMTAAKAGTLSTRTDANTGVLTLGSGHGVTDGQKISVFWSGGKRTNMTVGTVSGTSVPIDLGSGDDLPVVTTPITAQVPISIAAGFVANNAKMIAFRSNKRAVVEFMASGTPELTVEVEAGGNWTWSTSDGTANPMAGDTIDAIRFSQDDSSNVSNAAAGVLLDA